MKYERPITGLISQCREIVTMSYDKSIVMLRKRAKVVGKQHVFILLGDSTECPCEHIQHPETKHCENSV